MRAEMPFGRRHDGVVINGAGGGQHHPLRGVFAGHEGRGSSAPSKLWMVSGVPEDRAPDRLVREGGLHEGVVDEVVGRVLDGGVFLQDHALLARQLGRLEDRMCEDVAEHVEGDVARSRPGRAPCSS